MKKSVLFLVLIFFISSASAEIFLNSNFNKIYNLNDSFSLNISIEKQKDSSGYLECYLNCGEKILVNKKFYNIYKGVKQEFAIDFPLSAKGNCTVEVGYSGEKKISQGFEVTDLIDVDYSVNNKLFYPLEKITINGSAIKKNKEKLSGSGYFSINNLVNKSFEITNGSFYLDYTLKEDSPPGKYDISIEVFEKNPDEEIVNFGKKTGEIEVLSKPSFILLQGNDSVKPPFNFSSLVVLLDQSKQPINNDSLIVRLFDPEWEIAKESVVKSNTNFYYYFNDNASRAKSWILRAYYGDIFSEKPIAILENKKLDYDVYNFSNGTYVSIKNIGNVNYSGIVVVSLDGEEGGKHLINVTLNIGEEQLEPLDYTGVRNISIEGEKFNDVSLNKITGMAGAGELKISINSYFLAIVALLLLVISYLVIKYLIRFKKKSTGSKTSSNSIAYMVFFKLDSPVEDLNQFNERDNFYLSKISNRLYYLLLYSPQAENPDVELLNFTKKIRNKLMARGILSSAVINSGKFTDKEKFLKGFSLFTRKMAEHANGGILVSESVLNKTNSKPLKLLKFSHNDENYKMYNI